MAFLSEIPTIQWQKPLFCGILGNSLLSTVPGVSGAGPNPEQTLLTPVLDAELITNGKITSADINSDTPTGCPTPATITRAMMELTGITPIFINAGLRYPMTVPVIDALGSVGEDPRFIDAVPRAHDLFLRGQMIGRFLSSYSDLLVLGECVPGGTTTALCVLRALGYDARVSSSFVHNPQNLKEGIWTKVQERIATTQLSSPLDVIRCTGDPMMPVAAGIAHAYTGTLVLAGGSQMLAVCGVIKAMGAPLPVVATTTYVRDDATANIPEVARAIGGKCYFVDPGFGDLGHAGLARYCQGEVKEGIGAGGAMFLAYLMGFAPDEIQEKIVRTVTAYS
ncbi:MAG: TIGR00303 family protein [Methanoregula sp.]